MLYGALLLLAIAFAAHAPRGERAAAVAVACALLANWLLVGWTYAEHSPQALFGMDAIDWWSVMDALLGAFAVAMTCRWWGRVIWACACFQIAFHFTQPLLPVETFLGWLDFFLRAQVACFFLLGGKGAADRILGTAAVRWLGRVARRQHQAVAAP